MMDNDRRRAARIGGALYFAYYAGAASLIPFLSLYLRQSGLAGGQIGLLVAIPPVMIFLGAGLWGMAGDRAAGPSSVFRLTTLCSVAAALLIPVPGTVALLAIAIAVYALGQSGIVPLLDALVLNGLGDEAWRYGRVRLWGAVGWGSAAAGVGVIIDAFGLATVFSLYAGFLLLAVGISFLLPRKRGSPGRQRPVGAVSKLLRVRGFPSLLVLCVAEGIVFGVLANYLFIHLQEVGATGTLLGLMLTAATASEVVFFLMTPRLLRRFPAHRLVVLAVGVMVVRLLLYIPLETGAPALAIQLLHGPGFALFIAAAVTRAGQLAPAGTAATAQGAVTATNFGLGAALGAIGGGALLEIAGTRTILASAAGVAFLLLLGVLMHGALRRP